MTLREFAEQNDIHYRTAQTWLRRGKLQRAESGFTLAEGEYFHLNPDREDSSSASPVNLNPESLSACVESLNPESPIESLNPLRLNPESCSGCEALKLEVSAMCDRLRIMDSALWTVIDAHSAALESISDDLAALRTDTASVSNQPRVTRRNGRTEIVDGDYLESQRFGE